MSKISVFLLLIGSVLLIALIYSITQAPLQSRLLTNHQLLTTHVEGKQFPKTLIDPIGQSHQLLTPPLKIVSTVLAVDEILSELIPVNRLTGVTFLVDEPGISNVVGHYPKTIRRVHAEVETLLSLQPDLVIVANYTDATTVRLLLAAHIPVLRLSSHNSFEGIQQNILLLGEVLGTPIKAQQLVNQLQDQLTRIKTRTQNAPSPRIVYYGPNGASTGSDTLMDASIALIGAQNVLNEVNIQGHTNVSAELVIGLQPDVIIVSASFGEDPQHWKIQLINDPKWRDVPAIKNNRVYSVPGAWLTSVSQYRITGVEQLAALVHPTLFSVNAAINNAINNEAHSLTNPALQETSLVEDR
ncbi:MAG: ABC transporter substrate-binding protein [Moraxellaceae bacterium]|nr:MAG: ABC transporter substrate-binding protein [Moraxellaceae bacterium]